MAKVYNPDDYAMGTLTGASAYWTTQAGPASYAAGGFTPDVSDVSISAATDILAVIATAPGYSCSWDATAHKVKVYWYDYDAAADGAAVEVATATDLSGVTFQLLMLA